MSPAVSNIAVTPEQVVHHAACAIRRGESGIPSHIKDLSVPVYATDRDGRITFFNQACVDFAGRIPETGQDRWCVTWKLFTTDGSPLPHDRCPMAVAIREGRSVRGINAIAERPDGSRVEFQPFPTPVFDDAGEVIGAVNVLVGTGSLDQSRHLKAQATRCRRLAKSTADKRVAETLRLMAAEYEEQARSLERAH